MPLIYPFYFVKMGVGKRPTEKQFFTILDTLHSNFTTESVGIFCFLKRKGNEKEFY